MNERLSDRQRHLTDSMVNDNTGLTKDSGDGHGAAA